MALGFGRKKDATEAPDPQTPPPAASAVTSPAPATNADGDDNAGNLDLDSFAAELASGGLTHEPPLDSALRTPPPGLDDDDDDFDFPGSNEPTVKSLTDSEPLDLNKMFEVESRDAVASGKIPAPAPFVPPSMAERPQEPAAPFYDPQIPVPPAKKKLPLIPIVAAVLVLGVGGVAAKMFMGGSAPEPDTLPVAAPPSSSGAPTSSRASNSASVANSASTSSLPATSNSASVSSAPPAAGSLPVSSSPSASGTTSSLGAPATSSSSMAPSSSGTRGSTAAGAKGTEPMSPELKLRLKALWDQGVIAKSAKDYAGARAAWKEALRLRPGHPGFAESIAKLPRQ